jgi:hypothetical protein
MEERQDRLHFDACSRLVRIRGRIDNDASDCSISDGFDAGTKSILPPSTVVALPGDPTEADGSLESREESSDGYES